MAALMPAAGRSERPLRPPGGDDPAVAGEAGDLHHPVTRMDDRPRREAGHAIGPGSITDPRLAGLHRARARHPARAVLTRRPPALDPAGRSAGAPIAVRAIWHVEGVVWRMRRVRQDDV